MPLLRSLGLRVLDKYVDENSSPVSTGVCNEFQSQFQDDIPEVPAGYIYILPEEDYICRLTKVGTILSKNGHIWDFSTSATQTHQTQADYFASNSNGYRIDSPNHDSLLVPASDGSFSISFWILPSQHSGGVYDVLGKRLTSSSLHRFLLRLDGATSSQPDLIFFAADAAGTAEYSVRAPIISGRWSLVVARCDGTGKKISLRIQNEDGTLTSAEEMTATAPGCALPGDPFVLGRNPDLVSNSLGTGIFFIQQVCLWKKQLTTSEERELFADGRGFVRWSDPALPSFFADFNTDPFLLTPQSYKKYGTADFVNQGYTINRDAQGTLLSVVQDMSSPGSPCKTCESEPDCWPNAMPDYSPDALEISVTWTTAVGGCLPAATQFTLNRNSRQIVQGFRFGRTFESDEIELPCGGTLRFFLESTPYHMSQYRYRQYLGIETTFNGKTQIARFNITLGVALIKPSTTGNFTSPSPAGVNFNFPFSDSFADYAADIVAAGWTDFATVLYEEIFSATQPYPIAACLVANGYRFTVGSDTPEKRGGDCGWQMGVKDKGASVSSAFIFDSKYNYRAVGSTISNNPRVVPSDPLLNRPFTAVARGLLTVIDVDNAGSLIAGDLPFAVASFTGVLTSAEFVRPEPFTSVATDTRRRFGAGGCIDCDITASFTSQHLTGTPNPVIKTAKIFKTQCPQKTLSGAVAVPGMGAIVGTTTGAGLLRVVESFNGPPSEPNDDTGAEYSDRETTAALDDGQQIYRRSALHRGGTFVPSGQMQFTGKIDSYLLGANTTHLLVDIKPNQKIDPNNPGIYSATIVGSTKIAALPATDTVTAIAAAQPDLGTLIAPTVGRVPVNGSGLITVDNCKPCPPGKGCQIVIDGAINGLNWLVPMFVDSKTGPESALIGCGVPSPVPSAALALSSNGVITAPVNPEYDGTSDGCSGEFSGQLVYPVSGTTSGLSGAIFSRDQLPLRAGGLLAFVPGMSGSQTYQNPPSSASWGRFFPCVPLTGICAGLFEQGCDPGKNYCSIVRDDVPSMSCNTFGMIRAEVSVKDMTVSQTNDGRLRATLIYEVLYAEFQDVTVNTKIYWRSDNVNGISDSLFWDVTAIRHIAATVVETREVIFESSIAEDVCLRQSILNGAPAQLAFASEVITGKTAVATPVPFTATMTTIELEDIQFNRIITGSEGNQSFSTVFTKPFDPVVPNLSPSPSPYDGFGALNYRFNSWSPGSIHQATGLFNWETCCGAGGNANVAQDGLITYSPSVAVNPFSLVVPQIVDWSGATLSFLVSPQTTVMPVPIQYAGEYAVDFPGPMSFLGIHRLSKEGFSIFWSKNYAGGGLMLRLDPHSGTLEAFPAAAKLRVVARYRLAGYPDARWNRMSANQMQLVSADWSVGDWSIYLTVNPVVSP